MVVIALPFGIWALLWKRQDKLNLEETKLRFGSTYMELKLDRKMALLYNVIYMLRRLVFSFAAIILEDSPFAQVQVVIFHSFCVIIYLTYYRPFVIPALNRMEIFNEGCILVASMHLITFTDFSGDPEVQY